MTESGNFLPQLLESTPGVFVFEEQSWIGVLVSGATAVTLPPSKNIYVLLPGGCPQYPVGKNGSFGAIPTAVWIALLLTISLNRVCSSALSKSRNAEEKSVRAIRPNVALTGSALVLSQSTPWPRLMKLMIICKKPRRLSRFTP